MSTCGGCASAPEKIAAQYVSETQYQSYRCDQLRLETDRVTERIEILYKKVKTLSDNDQAQMSVGLILFWPALLFLEGGDGPEAAEYTRLKGEKVAIEQASLSKNCIAGKTPDTVSIEQPVQPTNVPSQPIETHLISIGGQQICDLSGVWEAQYSFEWYGLHTTEISIRRSGKKFVGTLKSGLMSTKTGEQVLRGTIKKNGFQEIEAYIPHDASKLDTSPVHYWRPVRGTIDTTCSTLEMFAINVEAVLYRQ